MISLSSAVDQSLVESSFCNGIESLKLMIGSIIVIEEQEGINPGFLGVPNIAIFVRFLQP